VVASRAMDDEKKPLPPGKTGLPLLGQTLSFLKDQFRFIDGGVAQHGPIFRSHVLGRNAVFLSGPEGTARFNDEADVQRAGGMPDFVEQFFGGKSLPLLDGDAHRARKQQVLGAFRREAIESYLPPMQAMIERWLEKLKNGGEFRAAQQFQRLALEAIARNMLSIEPGPELDTVIDSFAVLAAGFSGLPISLPGTRFTRALAARDRTFEVLRAAVRRHRERTYDDGLQRILDTVAGDGSRISDEDVVLELHHFNIAGYLIYTHFCALLVELHRSPEVRARLTAEVDAAAPREVTGPLTAAQLDGMKYLDQVVKELKRFTPFVPVFFGKAKRDFELHGHRVPAGWTVLWGHHSSNNDPGTYASPEKFDPERFGDGRAEHRKHPCAFAPQGAGELAAGHKCAGYDYSTLFMQAFTVLLVRGYTWELPPQNLAYLYTKVPPEHADGLRTILKPR
jgi:retinoid hydroxylase